MVLAYVDLMESLALGRGDTWEVFEGFFCSE